MLLYEKITKEIQNACYEVHYNLGSGLLEKPYENALLYELKLRGLVCENQVPVNLLYKGQNIGNYIVDILVDKKVILELKAVKELTSEHFAQVHHYLNSTEYNLAILINFGSKKLQFRRVLRNPETKKVIKV